MTEKSKYAMKYGEWVGAPGRSGLTPLPLSFPNLMPTREEAEMQLTNEQIKRFQLGLFSFYTTRDMMDSGVLTTRKMRSNNLTNSISDCLENWETEDTVDPEFSRRSVYHIAGQPEGSNWVAHNPLVKPLLDPILRLTSRILHNMHMLPWVS